MQGSLSSADSNQPEILDEVRHYLRLHHYSIHTERSYVGYIAPDQDEDTGWNRDGPGG
jgi:hypothetical protein